MTKKWNIIQKKRILQAKLFDYFQIQSQSLETGTKGEFDILSCQNWVNVIASTKEDTILFVKQFRHGIKEMTLELPGGVVEKDESALTAAQRELKEETGFVSESWKSLNSIHPNPAFMDNSCFVYYAENAKEFGPQELDECEEIEILSIPYPEIPGLITSGKITHSLTICSLFLYSLSYKTFN